MKKCVKNFLMALGIISAALAAGAIAYKLIKSFQTPCLAAEEAEK